LSCNTSCQGKSGEEVRKRRKTGFSSIGIHPFYSLRRS
jgi:hypothetical protein